VAVETAIWRTGMGGIRQCGLRHVWTGMIGSGVWMHWSGVETNKCHVKYEANVNELACDELNLALLSANLKAYLLKIKLVPVYSLTVRYRRKFTYFYKLSTITG